MMLLRFLRVNPSPAHATIGQLCCSVAPVTRLLLYFFVIIAALLSACSDNPEGGRPAKIYRHALDAAPANIDPVHAATLYANHVVINVYDTLYSYKYLARPYQIKANLAVGMPEVSADGLTYTIRIKPGVHFIDHPSFADGKGREVVAEDFVYSIKRQFDPKNRAEGAWMWQGRIVGLDEWKEAGADYNAKIEGLMALDDHTIQFKLIKPYPQLIHTLAQGYSALVPHEAVQYYGREISVHAVGSGPFMLKSIDAVKAVLVRNPNFRQEPIDLAEEGYDEALHGQYDITSIQGKIPPLVDQLEIHFINEKLSAWNSLTKADEVQLAMLPKELTHEVLKVEDHDFTLQPKYADRYHVLPYLESGFVHEDFNMRDPQIGYNDDPKRNEMNKALRCAIRYAFDWTERNKAIYSDLAEVFPGIILPVTPEFDANIPKDSIEFNPDKARALLKEAGWTAENLPTLGYGGVSDVEHRQMYEQFRGWMIKIGYPSEKIVFDTYASFGDFNKAVRQAKVMIVGMGWGLDYPDSENTLQLFYGPNGAPGSNSANFNNTEYNKLYEQAAVMLPSPERTALYQRMNQIMQDECVSITGLSRRRFMVWHQDVIEYPDREIVGGFALKYVDLRK